jgi:hypothetical protein
VPIAAVREPGFGGAVAALSSSAERAKPEAAEGPSPFARMLASVGREVQHGESVMRSAIEATHAGASIDPATLIALQAGVYRYSETVDLASRLVDRATASVKTVVQGQ